MALILDGSAGITFPSGSVQNNAVANNAAITALVGSRGLSPNIVPAGSVIQTVYGQASNQRYSTTSTSWVSMGSSLSITPLFSNSKILIRYTVSIDIGGGGSADGRLDVARTIGGTTTQNISGYSSGIQGINTNAYWMTATVEYLDSPGTTSTISYIPSVQLNSSSYTMYFNDNSGMGTSFVLQEIAA